MFHKVRQKRLLMSDRKDGFPVSKFPSLFGPFTSDFVHRFIEFIGQGYKSDGYGH